jgi:hypothetical protein
MVDIYFVLGLVSSTKLIQRAWGSLRRHVDILFM